MLFAVFKIYSFSRGELSQGSSLVGELGEEAANNEWWLPTFDDLDMAIFSDYLDHNLFLSVLLLQLEAGSKFETFIG